jgi:hypothetical protein
LARQRWHFDRQSRLQHHLQRRKGILRQQSADAVRSRLAVSVQILRPQPQPEGLRSLGRSRGFAGQGRIQVHEPNGRSRTRRGEVEDRRRRSVELDAEQFLSLLHQPKQVGSSQRRRLEDVVRRPWLIYQSQRGSFRSEGGAGQHRQIENLQLAAQTLVVQVVQTPPHRRDGITWQAVNGRFKTSHLWALQNQPG